MSSDKTNFNMSSDSESDTEKNPSRKRSSRRDSARHSNTHKRSASSNRNSATHSSTRNSSRMSTSTKRRTKRKLKQHRDNEVKSRTYDRYPSDVLFILTKFYLEVGKKPSTRKLDNLFAVLESTYPTATWITASNAKEKLRRWFRNKRYHEKTLTSQQDSELYSDGST